MPVKKPAPVTFGARLLFLRAEAGLTQAGLASRCGLTANTVARLERDEIGPRWETVQALAVALGVSTEAFRSESQPCSAVTDLPVPAGLFLQGQGAPCHYLGEKVLDWLHESESEKQEVAS